MLQVGMASVRETATDITRVLVVDDHRTFGELLSLALEDEPDLVCVGHALTAAEGLAATRRLRPDIVLMDLQLPDGDGITTAATICAEDPDVRVLILTAHPSPAEITRANAAGACAFLAKDGSLSEVLGSVRTATRGRLVLLPSLVASFEAARSRGPQHEVATDTNLTPRELDVLRLLGQGRDPRTIARELGMSLNTCRGHVKGLQRKLGVHSQLEAVVAGSSAGLIRLGDGRHPTALPT